MPGSSSNQVRHHANSHTNEVERYNKLPTKSSAIASLAKCCKCCLVWQVWRLETRQKASKSPASSGEQISLKLDWTLQALQPCTEGLQSPSLTKKDDTVRVDRKRWPSIWKTPTDEFPPPMNIDDATGCHRPVLRCVRVTQRQRYAPNKGSPVSTNPFED